MTDEQQPRVIKNITPYSIGIGDPNGLGYVTHVDGIPVESPGDVGQEVTRRIAALNVRKEAGEAFIKVVDEVTNEIAYKAGYGIDAVVDELGDVWFEVTCWRPDAITQVWDYGYGGRRRLDPTATRSDIVRNVFAAFRAYEEHECREFFRFRGEQVFGPHMDLDDLAQKLADQL